MLSDIRDRVKPWVEEIAKPFAMAGFRPNDITLLGLILGLLAGLLFSTGEPRWAGLVVLMAGFFDIIDGAVARLQGQVTKFGGVLDSVADRVTDAILFIGIMAGGMGALRGEPVWLLPALALLGSLMVSYTRARAEAAGIRKLDVGIAERAERLLILAVGALLGVTDYALLIIVVLTAITVAQRIFAARRRFEQPISSFE